MKKPIKSLITMLLVISLLMSNIAMFASYAATPYPVELAFDNIFVFEKWANNTLSSTVTVDGLPQDDETLLVTDLDEGSFTLTKKDVNASEVFTAHSMGTESAAQNQGYYTMPVEPNTTYTFSYNLDGNMSIFRPFVFYFDESGKYVNLAFADNNGLGDNSFNFTTPDNVTHIQIRFTVYDPGKTAYASVKNIAIYKVETVVDSTNLFDFDAWASNPLSTVPGIGQGTIVPDTATGSVKLTTYPLADNSLFSGFGMAEDSSNDAYYTVDVQPNTCYTLAYSIGDNNLPGPIHFQPYIIELDSEGKYVNLFNYETPFYIGNKEVFTTTPQTERIEVVFNIINDSQAISRYCTIEDIGVYKTTVTEHKVNPPRKAYTYGVDSTYGELPTPTYAPEGYVFAGWYTGKDGTGMHITSDTAIQPTSYTVYPKYEPKVDALEVVTMPAKTEYTIGEKLNTTGLVLQASINYQVNEDTNGDGTPDTTVNKTNTFNITSGYYCTPEYLTATGPQTITANYGGKTATFTVNVSNGEDKNIVVNGASYPVTVANNEYTLNYNASAFNRYEMTYFSDSYVKGTITMTNGVSEDFFLEPSDNGSFASYIDGFLENTTHTNVEKIKFTCLDKEYGNFELLSLTTINSPVPSDPMQYYQNNEYKVGIALNFGGVVSYIEDLDDDVRARVYNEGGKNITKVDYASKLSSSGVIQESTSVNLINTYDRGRYLQQSYYGTYDKPYNVGNYNGLAWNYNPVQGGNIKGDASKVIDYRITKDQIYVKTRPLDWGKWSEKYGSEYADEYITDSYMEAWYVFEDGMIKTYCRFVDYSGYPSNTTFQEKPALYTIEPLNNFVYNEVSEAWSGENLQNIEEPEFWGVLPEYHALLKVNGMEEPNSSRVAVENWAAFTASPDDDSFGIGLYSPGITDMRFGTFPAIYNEEQVKQGKLEENYRHAGSVNPANENPTSYIAPVDTMTFESYKPATYSFYITTGTAQEIHDDFERVGNADIQDELNKTRIAVPETAYMNPSNNKIGQYYVNNIINEDNYNRIETVAESDDNMYFGLHIDGATQFSVNITNVTDPTNDIYVGNPDGTGTFENIKYDFVDGTFILDNQSGLHFADEGLEPGEIATAKWDITAYFEDGTTETYTAYTVMYAPERTVGAVAEARQVNASQNEISSWITGANGVDHSKRSPLGSFHGDYSSAGYFREDPLINANPPTGGSGGNSHDYIVEENRVDFPAENTYYENAYVLQTATDDHDSSRAQSYLGLLTVDKSRYTNTNQIPNLRIGYDVLRIGTYTKNSLGKYTTYYTLGTESAYTATSLSAAPSGWTVYSGTYTDFADSHTLPYRESFVPSFSVSDIDGKYIHALNQGIADQTINTNQYSTAGTSVLCSVTDKGELRDSVLNSYTLAEEEYPGTKSPEFIEALEEAATILGDPSATQAEIDEAKKDLNTVTDKLLNAYYALKYDNLFSAYEFSQKTGGFTTSDPNGEVTYSAENAAITVTSKNTNRIDVSVGNGNNPDIYYNIDVKGSTEYIFEYDLESVGGSQMHLFFYDNDSANPQAWLTPTGKSYTWTPEGGSTVTVNQTTNTESFANVYAVGNGHVVMRFTTPAAADRVAFRFGNNNTPTSVSTFSNIRFIEADKYYADATYSKTEDLYNEFQSYGTLITPVRNGYTFQGWEYADGTDVTAADIATEHKSIYSQWTENKYTIVYNANGGSGSISNKTVSYTENVLLSDGSGFTTDDSIIVGWSTDPNATTANYKPGQTVSKLTGENNGTVTLYAVWQKVGAVNVTFDNLVDISTWSKTANSGTLENVTDTGFTVNSYENASEATSTSAYFPVEPGHKYKIEADIKGDNWDVYIFFHSATSTGTGIGFNDSENHLSSSNKVAEVNGTRYISTEFTAPENAVRAQLRVDANGSNNVVRFENIRVSDVAEQTYVDPVNKYVEYNEAYGELPVPVKEGYLFCGWVDADNNMVTEDDIMSSSTTVFLTSTWKENPNKVNDDTVVIEYGLPVVINVLSNDKTAVTVTAIGTSGVTEADIGNTSHTESILTDKNGELSLTNGKVTLNENGTITYTLTTTNVKAEDVFYYEVQEGNSYYYAKVTVIPATTIYYEDTFFKFEDSTVTKNGETRNYEWEEIDDTLDTSVSDVFQNTDRPGEFNFADDLNNVYGYDSSFDDQVTYSGGSAHYVEVDQFAGSNVPKATFTFTGTGFDLFTVTNSKSGTITATIYKGANVDSQQRLKGIIANAYFGYRYDENTQQYVAEDNGTIYQVPVIRAHDLDYGTYTVVVEPRYNQAFDVQNTGKCGVYVDSVRIYNPMDDDNEIANDAYIADGEYAPQYLEIRDTLVTPKGDGTYEINELGVGKTVFLDGGKTSMDDFAKIGPKNEVYLKKDDAVAFNIVTETPDLLPSTIQIGMKLTGKDNVGSEKVTLANALGWSEVIDLNSTTERYYNIESVVDWVKQADGTYKTSTPVVITNTSDVAIISLTSIKWAFDSPSASVTKLSLEADEQTPVMAMFAIRRVVDSGVQDDPQQTIPDTDNVEVVEPDVPDDKTDDITVDSDSGSGIMGIDSFINALLTRLFNILKTVFDMLMGGVTV